VSRWSVSNASTAPLTVSRSRRRWKMVRRCVCFYRQRISCHGYRVFHSVAP